MPTDWISPSTQFLPDDTLLCPDLGEGNCGAITPFRAMVDETSTSSADAPVHYINLLDIGEEALLLRLHLIRAARKSIYIQQYIWSADASGLLIFRELVEAAQD